MNILHLHEQIEIKGGSEIYIHDLLRYGKQFDLKGYWIGVSQDDEGYTVQLRDKYQGKVKTKEVQEWSSYLAEFCRSRAIDVIHIHGLSAPNVIKAAWQLKPVVRSLHEPRVICPGHGKYWLKSETPCTVPFGLHCFWHAYTQVCASRHPKKLWQQYQNTWFEINKATPHYKQLIVMSSFMKDEAQHAQIPEEKITLLPYFTDIIEEEPRFPKQNKTVVFSGRISPEKGPHYLLEAMQPVLQEYDNVTLAFAGSGRMEEEMKTQVRENGMGDQVDFLGWISKEELHRLYREAYLVVVPSLYPEAFGIIGIEAMMHGKPVVAFDNGGIPQWLEHNKTGFLVESKNTEVLRQRITQLLEDKELYQNLGKTARQTAKEKYTPEKHIHKLKRIYENVG